MSTSFRHGSAGARRIVTSSSDKRRTPAPHVSCGAVRRGPSAPAAERPRADKPEPNARAARIVRRSEAWAERPGRRAAESGQAGGSMRLEQLTLDILEPDQRDLYDTIVGSRTGSTLPGRVVDEDGTPPGPVQRDAALPRGRAAPAGARRRAPLPRAALATGSRARDPHRRRRRGRASSSGGRTSASGSTSGSPTTRSTPSAPRVRSHSTTPPSSQRSTWRARRQPAATSTTTSTHAPKTPSVTGCSSKCSPSSATTRSSRCRSASTECRCPRVSAPRSPSGGFRDGCSRTTPRDRGDQTAEGPLLPVHGHEGLGRIRAGVRAQRGARRHR